MNTCHQTWENCVFGWQADWQIVITKQRLVFKGLNYGAIDYESANLYGW